MVPSKILIVVATSTPGNVARHLYKLAFPGIHLRFTPSSQIKPSQGNVDVCDVCVMLIVCAGLSSNQFNAFLFS